MRLLHTGDLHLDSAFRAYGQRGAEQQREAGREMLRRIFECAKTEKCDMILIAGDPDRDFVFLDKTPEREVALDTRELRAVLGDVSLGEFEVLEWIKSYLYGQYQIES